MGPELSHEELQELLGGYALGAVAADERRAVESHLPGCPRCRAEVTEHLETAALLAGAGAPAPEGVWQRIAASVSEPPAIAVDAARRRGVPSPLRWAAGVAAAALVASTGLLGLKVLEQDRQLEALASARGGTPLRQEAALALLDERSRRLQLRSAQGDAAAVAAIRPDGTGFLVRDNLRVLPPERTYQLWMLVQGRAISAGVLGRDPGITAFKVPPRIEGLAITVERAGGVPTTRNTPVVAAEIGT